MLKCFVFLKVWPVIFDQLLQDQTLLMSLQRKATSRLSPPSASSRTRRNAKPSTKTSSRCSKVELSEVRPGTVLKRSAVSRAARLRVQTKRWDLSSLQRLDLSVKNLHRSWSVAWKVRERRTSQNKSKGWSTNWPGEEKFQTDMIWILDIWLMITNYQTSANNSTWYCYSKKLNIRPIFGVEL